MATIINKSSGVLLEKPSKFDVVSTEFETKLVDTFFVGKEHPIDFSPDFRKTLKQEFDLDEIDVRVDLTAGNNELLDKPGTLSFDLLLDYLMGQRKLYNKDLKEIVYGASIVCRRGVLNKLVNAPYSSKMEFQFAVKKFQGIFFIKEISTETYQRQYVKRLADPHAYLPKFKNHIIAPYGNESYEQPAEISTWEQMQGWYICDLSYMNKINPLKIFYGTEIDAFDKDGKLVEIKLQKGELGQNNPSYYTADKMRKWYFQTELTGSDTIVVGFRDDTTVTSIKKIKIDTLSSMVKEENQWHACSSYCSVLAVLSSVVDTYNNRVQGNETLVVELRPKENNIMFHIRNDEIHNVLPQEFREEFGEVTGYMSPKEDDLDDGCTKHSYIVDGDRSWLDSAFEKALNI